MTGKIAVEQNLSPVANYLASRGYTVTTMNVTEMLSGNKDNFDAYVISGASENFLGMQDRLTDVSVINASGLSPEDVAFRIYEAVQ
jgi:acetolactate synthase regulatory subunit